METLCFFETLVSTYESTRRHNPEQQHRQPVSTLQLQLYQASFLFRCYYYCYVSGGVV
jgi:hypothetical protein